MRMLILWSLLLVSLSNEGIVATTSERETTAKAHVAKAIVVRVPMSPPEASSKNKAVRYQQDETQHKILIVVPMAPDDKVSQKLVSESAPPVVKPQTPYRHLKVKPTSNVASSNQRSFNKPQSFQSQGNFERPMHGLPKQAHQSIGSSRYSFPPKKVTTAGTQPYPSRKLSQSQKIPLIMITLNHNNENVGGSQPTDAAHQVPNQPSGFESHSHGRQQFYPEQPLLNKQHFAQPSRQQQSLAYKEQPPWANKQAANFDRRPQQSRIQPSNVPQQQIQQKPHSQPPNSPVPSVFPLQPGPNYPQQNWQRRFPVQSPRQQQFFTQSQNSQGRQQPWLPVTENRRLPLEIQLSQDPPSQESNWQPPQNQFVSEPRQNTQQWQNKPQNSQPNEGQSFQRTSEQQQHWNGNEQNENEQHQENRPQNHQENKPQPADRWEDPSQQQSADYSESPDFTEQPSQGHSEQSQWGLNLQQNSLNLSEEQLRRQNNEFPLEEPREESTVSQDKVSLGDNTAKSLVLLLLSNKDAFSKRSDEIKQYSVPST